VSDILGSSGDTKRRLTTKQSPSPAKPVPKLELKNTISSAPIDDDAVRILYDIPANAEIIYTDGSCLGNDSVTRRAGVGVYFSANDPRNISARLPGNHQTSGHAELFAVLKALETVYHSGSGRQGRVVILSDSLSVVQKFATRGSKMSGKKSCLSNSWYERGLDLMKALEAEGGSKESVTFKHIPGHRGILGNMEADRLARMGAKMADSVDQATGLDEDLDLAIMELELYSQRTGCYSL
jgi:ribonuclease HI